MLTGIYQHNYLSVSLTITQYQNCHHHYYKFSCASTYRQLDYEATFYNIHFNSVTFCLAQTNLWHLSDKIMFQNLSQK